jgi:hypothetical protein
LESGIPWHRFLPIISHKDNPKKLLPMHILPVFNTIPRPFPNQIKDNVPRNHTGEQALKPNVL